MPITEWWRTCHDDTIHVHACKFRSGSPRDVPVDGVDPAHLSSELSRLSLYPSGGCRQPARWMPKTRHCPNNGLYSTQWHGLECIRSLPCGCILLCSIVAHRTGPWQALPGCYWLGTRSCWTGQGTGSLVYDISCRDSESPFGWTHSIRPGPILLHHRYQRPTCQVYGTKWLVDLDRWGIDGKTELERTN
jgi:hypothetical protein